MLLLVYSFAKVSADAGVPAVAVSLLCITEKLNIEENYRIIDLGIQLSDIRLSEP